MPIWKKHFAIILVYEEQAYSCSSTIVKIARTDARDEILWCTFLNKMFAGGFFPTECSLWVPYALKHQGVYPNLGWYCLISILNFCKLFPWVILEYFLLLEFVYLFILQVVATLLLREKDKGICFTFSVALMFLYLCQITSCSSLNLSVHWLLINMWNISLSTDWYCHLNIYSCMLKMSHVVLLSEFCLLGSISWQNHCFHIWVLNFLNT